MLKPKTVFTVLGGWFFFHIVVFFIIAPSGLEQVSNLGKRDFKSQMDIVKSNDVNE